MAKCNVCGNTEFETFRGRPEEVCTYCGARARHRVAMDVYQRFLPGFTLEKASNCRVLHLAPEKCLHPIFSGKYGAGYVTADPFPEKYPHSQSLKLFFPQDYHIFPEGYFDAIVHNHVLEHIPGSFRDHIRQFADLLKPDGVTVISVPGPYAEHKTIEGGEFLKTDKERLEKFLQEDHFKLFGTDFGASLRKLTGGQLLDDGVTDEFRSSVSVRPGKANFFVWKKDS